MKKDMHYYGTFAMARAAGVELESARIIATAAQYVDEAAVPINVELEDGSHLVTFPTGHHMNDIKNVLTDDQRQVWVPFHFLPGGEGETFSERMVCQQDSSIAREMVAHHLEQSSRAFGRELMGVAAHVYADTFAHYGFSGFSSRQNEVKGDSIEVDVEDPEVEASLLEKAMRFLTNYGSSAENFRRKFMSDAAEGLSAALGHGAVCTYPDMPFLWWCFDYEDSRKGTSARRNDETFLEACRALHKMFSDFLLRTPEYRDVNGGVEFDAITDAVRDVLSVQKDTEGRIAAWKMALEEGRLTAGPEQEVPEHREDAWSEELKEIGTQADSVLLKNSSPYKFFQAASLHRNYVLRTLLPEHGLVVI